jgi:hypothetical protein
MFNRSANCGVQGYLWAGGSIGFDGLLVSCRGMLMTMVGPGFAGVDDGPAAGAGTLPGCGANSVGPATAGGTVTVVVIVVGGGAMGVTATGLGSLRTTVLCGAGGDTKNAAIATAPAPVPAVPRRITASALATDLGSAGIVSPGLGGPVAQSLAIACRRTVSVSLIVVIQCSSRL